ncbi:putative ABC transporter permease [Loigolactobacillus zhaoyuanensis]|uniref:ABC transporter permease n=1 Tax=Loigolactobacillus zhaoyuanensis TaxID=2486017 RepID=A0ABW8UED7_9LACO|nr:putative ABC transporter permease [Loigolactobacillus zhaoyuanensis]
MAISTLQNTFEQQFSLWVLYFFAYAFVGWLWESAYVSVRKRHWVNSGFLIGPIIPVYGFSMAAVLAVIEPFENNLVVLYLLSALLVTLIEYVTSWLMEQLFHARWWDYSDVPLNINGRVAIPISLFWGVGVVLIVKFIQPLVAHLVLYLAVHYGIFMVIGLIAILMFDFGFTLANVIAFGAATKRIGDAIEDKKGELKAKVADTGAKLEHEHAWLEAFRANTGEREQLPNLNFVQRRLLRSFPHLRLNNTRTSVKDISALAELRKRLAQRK